MTKNLRKNTFFLKKKTNFCHKIFILKNYLNSQVTLFSYNVTNIS